MDRNEIKKAEELAMQLLSIASPLVGLFAQSDRERELLLDELKKSPTQTLFPFRERRVGRNLIVKQKPEMKRTSFCRRRKDRCRNSRTGVTE